MARLALASVLTCAFGLGATPSVARAQVEAEFADEFDAAPEGEPETTDAPAEGAPEAGVTFGTTVATDEGAAVDADAAVAAVATDEGAVAEDRFRSHNTWLGPVGGLRVVDAGSGEPSTFRLQLGVDFFLASDYLVVDDSNDWLGGTVSLSWTLAEFLEVFGAVANHANSNSEETPELLQVLGDSSLGIKAFNRPIDWLALGGDFRLVVLNTVGDVGPVLSGTSFGFRLGASTDLRRLREPFPLQTRLSFDYFFDNSGKLIEDVEDARYAALGAAARDRLFEDRHLLRRVERFALGINRVDTFSIGVGIEAPLRAAEDFHLHPLAEWQIGIPVNRQNFDCLALTTDASAAGPDGCLDTEGIAAIPSTLTLGVRILPPVRGLSFALGVDVGTSGASTFVREVAPNKPYDVLIALAYAVDPRPRGETVTREVVREVERPAPEKPRVAGTVVVEGTGVPVAGAVVRYPGTEFTAQLAGDDGRFTSYGLDAGEVNFEVSHPDYETRVCAVRVPETVASAPSAAGAEPVAGESEGAGGGASAEPAPDANGETSAESSDAGASGVAGASEPVAPAPIPLTCELALKPRGELRGTVVNEKGHPVAGAKVALSGPRSHDVSTDASGAFALSALEPAEYQARVEAEGYLVKSESFHVAAGLTAVPRIVLTARPKVAQVELTQKEVRIRQQIHFKSGSAEILSDSDGLLSEIADVLIRNPQVKAVEIQGHTDNTGTPANNLRLSQERADAVMRRLTAAGVTTTLTAKGHGDTQPLAPNITSANRARNRRVQFMLR
jgi:outer membrane protein OmpA-like peptidoglycan-associated protein